MAIQIEYSDKYRSFYQSSYYWSESTAHNYYFEKMVEAIHLDQKTIDLPMIHSLKESLHLLYDISYGLKEDLNIDLLVLPGYEDCKPDYVDFAHYQPSMAKPSYYGSFVSNKKEQSSRKEPHLSFITGFLTAPRKEECIEPEDSEDELDWVEECAVEENLLSLDEFVKDMGRSFSESVLAIIDEHQWKDSDVYKRANITKSVFSTLRSNKDYQPTKNTALALAVGLRLDVDETNDLLEKAGYILSNSDMTDRIVEYHIRKKDYDISNINLDLFYYHKKILGAK